MLDGQWKKEGDDELSVEGLGLENEPKEVL